jgi:hypothetical protein
MNITRCQEQLRFPDSRYIFIAIGSSICLLLNCSGSDVNDLPFLLPFALFYLIHGRSLLGVISNIHIESVIKSCFHSLRTNITLSDQILSSNGGLRAKLMTTLLCIALSSLDLVSNPLPHSTFNIHVHSIFKFDETL